MAANPIVSPVRDPFRVGPNRHTPARKGGVLSNLVILLVIAGGIAGGGYYYFSSQNTGDVTADLIVHPAKRAPFDHIVLEQGEIESSRNTELVCEVKSSSGGGGGVSILWVIDEGTPVKKGDKLVELDSSQLEQEQKQQRIVLGNAEANVTSGIAAVEQAVIARQEYLEGVYMTDEKAIESEIAVAQQDLRKAKLALDSSERLVAKGLVKSLQLDADQFAVANAQNKLDAAQGRLKVLQNLTRQKMLVQFDSDIAAARAALEALRGTLEEEKEKMAELEQQIAACVMTAPTDGVVVHANKYSRRGGNAEVVIEAGAVVRERQAIIRLPDPSLMQVNAKINESRVTLVREGMPAKIRVDAVPGLELAGRVTKVNRYAEPGSFFSSSIKEYATIIEIIDPPEGIRTGMTAEAQIFVEQLPDALQIPIQGIYEYKNVALALVDKGNGELETRTVKVGAANSKMATIQEGIAEGEKVVLNLRDHLDLVDLPTVAAVDNSDMMAIRQMPSPGSLDGPSDDAPPSNPAAQAMVQQALEENDTDGDGQLSEAEVAAAGGRFRSLILDADSDGDGNVNRTELTAAVGKRMAANQRGGGPGEGPPGPAGPRDGGGPGDGGPGGGGPAGGSR